MIYDYHCDACDKDMEIEHSIKRKPRKKCPFCKKMKLRRMISFNENQFVLSGDCWEKDGYSTKKNA
jgi:putative FmdB family regulatory protein